MFDTSKIDVAALGLEAACKLAYEAGVKDGSINASVQLAAAEARGFERGCAHGIDISDTMLLDATTVRNVYWSGDYTVLEFRDGQKVKVKYSPEYGCAYDREKAVMAALLKRIMGNRYIKVLRTFCSDRKAASDSVSIQQPQADDGTAGAFTCLGDDDSWREFFDSIESDAPSVSDAVRDPVDDGVSGAFQDLSDGDPVCIPDCGAGAYTADDTDACPDAPGMAGAFQSLDDSCVACFPAADGAVASSDPEDTAVDGHADDAGSDGAFRYSDGFEYGDPQPDDGPEADGGLETETEPDSAGAFQDEYDGDPFAPNGASFYTGCE